MNSTGKLLPPGSAGGVVANIWMPGIADSFACTSGRISVTERVRSDQGLTTSPPKPSAPSEAPIDGGNMNWKVIAASGVSSSTASAAFDQTSSGRWTHSPRC